ncbi:MAG: glycoside hydrolase family 3 C-terminal domain-containing protein [Oscillospiraceae bacterium]|nr:glycoside hydrolase family 3 C-terminal domain-containing protein [Oscillospiraceae bacterium]
MSNSSFKFPFFNPDLPLEERLDNIMSLLKKQEKFGFLTTQQKAVERLSIPAFSIGGEGAHGYINRLDESTSFPQTIGLAATWDRNLLSDIGKVTADEARAFYNTHGRKEGITLWFPTVDLERSPYWGRTEEGYGEDPYLTSQLAVSIIRAAQDEGSGSGYLKITSGPKHFFANNNEKDRGSCNSSIPPRAIHEYYLKPFEAVVKDGGAYSLMTAYNEVNGIPMLLHPYLNTIVKDQWGLSRGHIVSDGDDFGQTVTLHKYVLTDKESIAAALKAGNDAMTDNSPEKITAAVAAALEDGLIDEAIIDEHVRNVLRTRFMLGQFDPEDRVPYNSIGQEVVQCDEHIALSRKTVAESAVLLKNSRGLFPLKPESTSKIAVLGHMATQVYADWYTTLMSYGVTPLDGLKACYGEDKVDYLETRDIVSFYTKDGYPIVMSGEYNALFVGEIGQEAAEFYREEWGFGSNTFRSVANGLLLDVGFDTNPNQAPTPEERERQLAIMKEFPLRATGRCSLRWFVSTQFCITTVGDYVNLRAFDGQYFTCAPVGGVVSLERPYGAGEQNEFIMKVKDTKQAAFDKLGGYDAALVFAGSNPMIHARECIDRPSLDLPEFDNELFLSAAQYTDKCAGIIVTSYPYDISQIAENYGTLLTLSHGMQELGNGLADVISGKTPPAGRLPMGWVLASRHPQESVMEYDIMKYEMTYQYDPEPAIFPFGHGLTYTSFEYGNLKIEGEGDARAVSFDLKNTGNTAGDEVPQMYISISKTKLRRAIKSLKGFDRVHLNAGEETHITFPLPDSEFTAWDVTRDRFVLENGQCKVMVGRSSEDILLSDSFDIIGEDIPKRVLDGVIYPWKCDSYERLEFVEKRGSATPAVKSSENGGTVDFYDCTVSNVRTLRLTCAGLSQKNELEVYVSGGNSGLSEESRLIGTARIPYTGDVAEWGHIPGFKNPIAWQTVDLPTDLPEGDVNLTLVLYGEMALYSVEFVK